MIALISQLVGKSVLAPINQRFKNQQINICPPVDFGSRKEFSWRGSFYCPFVLEIIESIRFKEFSKRRYYDCPFALNYSVQQIESACFKNSAGAIFYSSTRRGKRAKEHSLYLRATVRAETPVGFGDRKLPVHREISKGPRA